MDTFSELIERFGGAAKMSAEIGEPANTIRQWSARGSIPARHWHTIVDAARRLYIAGVSFEVLATLAARARADQAATAAVSEGQVG
jgi:hypothetical protein